MTTTLELALLGQLVWWDAMDGMRSTRSKLVAAVEAAGMHGLVSIPDVDAQTQIRRAIHQWTFGRGNADRFRTEHLPYDTTRANVERASVLKLVNPDNDSKAYVQLGVVESHYDTHADKVENRFIPDDGADELPGIVRDSLFGATADATLVWNDTIRKNVIEKVLSSPVADGGAGGVSIRRQGGVWYVTQEGVAAVGKLKSIIETSTATKIGTATVSGDDDSRASIANSVQVSMMDDLSITLDKLKVWSEDRSQLENGRTKRAVSDSVTEVGALIKRAQLYELALNHKLTDLRDTARKAADDMYDLLGVDPATRATILTATFGAAGV